MAIIDNANKNENSMKNYVAFGRGIPALSRFSITRYCSVSVSVATVWRIDSSEIVIGRNT